MIKYEHLVGVPFDFGKDDCFQLGRRLFMDNWGIEIPNFSRPNDFWDVEGFDLFREHYLEAGFVFIDEPLHRTRIGDVFLMSIQSKTKVMNHGAVYVGGGDILHHPYSRLSEKVPYRGLWRNTTCATLRHPDVPDLRAEAETVDVMKLLPAHTLRKLEDLRNGL